MKGKMGIFKQSKIQIISLISLVAMILLLILGGNIAKADDVSSSSSSSTSETSSSVVVKSQDSSNVSRETSSSAISSNSSSSVSSTSGSSSSVQGNTTSKANTQVYVVATVDNSKANNTDKDTDQQADASSVEVVVADNESQPSEYASVKVSNKNVKKHSELSMPKIESTNNFPKTGDNAKEWLPVWGAVVLAVGSILASILYAQEKEGK
ncbi:glucosyltransferase-S [Ligilactobacillus salivarius]|uniref:Glucosyltransferase-S n=1 Tax=Ligilactobacillus salivarius TaxID=1624 RepID=A0ABD7YUK5_9LACO|nr:glucosyltransferase-S [Ligilactobacillus salivarius]WHS05752.1 glucosyltransferase-S [Ligilactobacillus salivarius]WHS08170.1 glucosyltransferase-S [Ligilactobacillus salivarius]WHS09665.1 glucosyltransferase-S [Ligilactobacillus salivarius]WHS13603.1 glucosyltransferase-S [Ligilactobacillus salivarius]WHS17780.1 glucosyltransferase-S [Ligilactobacillus salivarius]